MCELLDNDWALARISERDGGGNCVVCVDSEAAIAAVENVDLRVGRHVESGTQSLVRRIADVRANTEPPVA